MSAGMALEGGPEQAGVPSEKGVVHFPRGVIGFEELHRYALSQLEPPFHLLQAVGEPQIGFLLLDPLCLDSAYPAELSGDDRLLLELEDNEPPLLLCIVTLSPDGIPSSVNLRAPVAINQSKRLGTQVVLRDSRYPVRFPLTASREAGLEPGEGAGAHSKSVQGSNGGADGRGA